MGIRAMTAGMPRLDHTHDPVIQSWVVSANLEGCEFPIQNLPFGQFRASGAQEWRVGVAIGDAVLDLRQAGVIDHADMRRLLSLTPDERRTLRQKLHAGLMRGSEQERLWRVALSPMSQVQLGLPCDIRDYTDFYVGMHHATAVGKLFRPENPLLPNYKWVPIGYHGRASTIFPSGQSFRRPHGQVRGAPGEAPQFGPCRRLDYELELGIIVGRPNAPGEPVAIADAEDHVFGLTLFNDWSARDIQAWEYQPLGPFLSKNFASTISPWIVTLEALAPFRRPFVRADGDPAPLPYLDCEANCVAGAIDIELEVHLQTQAMRAAGSPPEILSRSNFADAAYWTMAQLMAHHTSNGCTLSTGDLLGTGTLSGPEPQQAGSLLELAQAGHTPIALTNGETRSVLHDGDAVVLRGSCRRAGFRSIGFGSCEATVSPARDG